MSGSAIGSRWSSDDAPRGHDYDERFRAMEAAGLGVHGEADFVAPEVEADVVESLADHLAPGGRLIAGFQLLDGRYDLETYDRHCAATGLVLDERFATWNRQPWLAGGDYAVSVHRPA
jgi:hypothetical protein